MSFASSWLAFTWIGVIASGSLLLSGCTTPPELHADSSTQSDSTTIVKWRLLGSWAGRGNTQTESFTMESGAIRVQWETRNEASPGSGRFRVSVHSAISGRPMLLAVDHRGPGHDISYLHEDPHVLYGVVESAGIDWSFRVEEAVFFTKSGL